MVTPRQADGSIEESRYLSQNYNQGIFSNDPQQEKDLAEYFFWLRSQFKTGKMTEAQRSDYEVLQMRQNWNAINNIPTAQLTPEQLALKNKLSIRGSSGYQTPIGDVEILKDASELPRFAQSSQGATGYVEEVKFDINDPNAPTLYRARDNVKNTTKYFYVLKDVNKFDKITLDRDSTLERYTKLADIVRQDPQTDGGGGGSGGVLFSSTIDTPKTTPAKLSKLWYSKDYNVLYDTEVKRISLQTLAMPELVLSNYDWETIDYVPDTVGRIIMANGEVTSYTYATDKQIIKTSVNPQISEMIYKMQNTSFAPIIQSLDFVRSGFETYLQNFGHYIKRSQNKGITQYFPGYYQNGEPYYDIEVTFEDIGEVTGYTIYLVEEDGII